MREQLALLLLFVPIIADSWLTVLRRTWAGHHPFTPHFDFYYQRMYLHGYTKRQIVWLHWIAVLTWGFFGYLLA